MVIPGGKTSWARVVSGRTDWRSLWDDPKYLARVTKINKTTTIKRTLEAFVWTVMLKKAGIWIKRYLPKHLEDTLYLHVDGAITSCGRGTQPKADLKDDLERRRLANCWSRGFKHYKPALFAIRVLTVTRIAWKKAHSGRLRSDVITLIPGDSPNGIACHWKLFTGLRPKKTSFLNATHLNPRQPLAKQKRQCRIRQRCKNNIFA